MTITNNNNNNITMTKKNTNNNNNYKKLDEGNIAIANSKRLIMMAFQGITTMK